MTYQDEIFTIEKGDTVGVAVEKVSEKEDVTVWRFAVRWQNGTDEISVCWRTPMLDILGRWFPMCRTDRTVPPTWRGWCTSSFCYNSPLYCHYNGKQTNRYTFSLSECLHLVYSKSGVNEVTGNLECSFRLPLGQFTGKNETVLFLRIDTRPVTVGEAISDAAAWWEEDCALTPAPVPDECRDPLYSFWYSYHQDITTEAVLAECKRARDLGFSIAKIVDGWQTDDCNLGYAYCGDWEPAKSKIPDMKAMTDGIHALGMKYILWYSAPFVGIHTKNYERFLPMALRFDDAAHEVMIVDPRYKEVRDWLISTYVNAERDWAPDGIRLDFIDSWIEHPNNAPYNERMDIPDLFEAVYAFLRDAMAALRAINPRLMFEFRQGYIGPCMRQFGNIFRVSDCPDDYISNRVGILDLRMLVRGSAVHCDMLMWHKDEKPETAALQIIGTLFGTLQYSARIENMSEECYAMSRFWLSFMKEHKKLLLESDFACFDPANLYTWAKTTDREACAVAVYAPDHIVTPDARSTVYLANGCMETEIPVALDGVYDTTVYSCTGRIESKQEAVVFSGIRRLSVPVGGLAVLTKAVP